MNFFKKTFTLSLLALFASPSFAKPVTEKKLVDKIIAVVNQDIILYSEFETYSKGMETEFKKTSEKNQMKTPEAFQKKALDQKIEDILLEQEVKTLGLEATDSQVESVVDEVMKNNNLRSRKDLDRALRGEGITYDVFVSEYKKRIGRSNLVNQTIRPKIKISEDEIETEFKKKTKSEGQQLEYQVGMILIPKGHVTMKEMEKIRKSIQSLSDFANIANIRTEGPGKGKGGDMGWIDASDLQPPLGDVLKKMRKGTVSAVVQTETGNYILAYLDSKSKASEEETKIRNEIQDDLMNTLLTKNLNQYILDLKRKAHIETFL